MRKQILCIILLFVTFLNACSVQEKMNSEIFFERLSIINNCLNITDIINDNEKCIYYVNDDKSVDYIFEFYNDNIGDINKISFACNRKDKAEDFIKYMCDIIFVYSPNENKDEIISELTENGKLKPKYTYYDTKWYIWSSFSDENGLYFSVVNKKLSEETIAKYSLKQNDRNEF